MNWKLCSLLAVALLGCRAIADLAAPPWYVEGGAGDWHYRVALTIPPAAAPNSTVHVDLDISALLAQLGIDANLVDVDERSVRIVRPNGTLVAIQEFTDVRFAGVLDATNDGRGEVRFLLEDAPAAGDHFVYFDIVENGAKPVVPSQPVNGNFENSIGATPTGWITSAVNANGAQNNEVYRTGTTATMNLAAGCSSNAANGLDTSPNGAGVNTTGQAWHLLGYRDNCEDGAGSERIRLSRNINVPAGGAAGNLTFFFQVQSFDGISNNNNYDWMAFYVNGVLVNHNALGIDNSTAPALRIDNTRLGRNGWGASVLDFGWKQATLNLAAYAGSTINFRFETRSSANDNLYRSWIKLDDVTWSRQDATLGVPEGFGANVVLPNDTSVQPISVYNMGDTMRIEVAVDASGTAASVSADVIDPNPVVVAAGVLLFDDGSHGDSAAGDGIYTNDGATGSEPTYTFTAGDLPGDTWVVRASALDGSTSSVGATNGLVLRPGQPSVPEDSQNFFNVDDQTFRLAGAVLEVARSVSTFRDPTLHAKPKAIPGAWLEHLVTVANRGPDAVDVDTVVIIDDLGGSVALCVTSACMCSVCASYPAPDPSPDEPVVFDDGGSPEPTGLTFDYATDVTFSTDGVTFTTTTAPDGFGFDPSISHIRIAPKGSMNGPGAGGDPEFTLRYRVRVE